MSSLPLIVGRLVTAVHPIRIILFGSHARKDAVEGSDLDLLVIVDHSDDLRETTIELRVAIGDLSVPVDIVVGTPALIEKYGNVVGYIYRPALSEGVAIYERR
jgi:predicted nucleotidyltransferase